MPLPAKPRFVAAALVTSLLMGACGSDDVLPPPATEPEPSTGQNGDSPAASGVFLVFGGDGIDAAVRSRYEALLASALGKPVQVVAAEAVPTKLDATSLVIAIGDSSLARELIPAAEHAALAPEAFVVRSGKRGDATLLAADGKPAKHHPHGNLGALHGAYALLEELGFAFLHPLAPVVPKPLHLPSGSIDRKEAPRWDDREIHLHTMHPLELTELLQGFGTTGPEDAAGFEAMLPEWDRFLEWSIANGQNGVEWFLLWAESWSAFADSDVRLGRLTKLVERAHAYSISVGIDAPIAFAQQHSFRLLRKQGDLADELSEIRTRLDWLAKAGWDFYGIEAGTSEFTAPDPARMLAWMNEVAKHLDEKHGGKRAFIKVHCSTGQVAEDFPDPKTGEPINFNMLPHHADKRLGVLPHTVQHYSLTDPAPTYGNKDFGYIRDFIRQEAGTRPVVFYPETAYWVSFDVDVPLFLPLYADRRLYDLRLLAQDEVNGAAKMDGQLIFSSGWEWGYWLNDVIAARAAWDPSVAISSQSEALTTQLARSLRVFGAAKDEVVAWLVEVVAFEQAALIEGKAAGLSPSDVAMRNGQAYLQGWETWDDVNKVAENTPAPLVPTQPDKLGLVDMRNPLHGGPSYTSELAPLLSEMETRFAQLASKGDALRAKVPAEARDLMDDLADAMRMTALRAAQVHGLYDYVDEFWNPLTQSQRKVRLAAARTALDTAKTIVAQRETRYRVPADRIAGWRNNPTAYEYGYLWSVRSLHFWWRDEGKAVDAPLSPCYLNIVNPVDVAFGEGFGTDASRWMGDFLTEGDRRGCLAEPTAEPKYPHDNLRSRP
jgi:hypothetical protein